MQAAFQRLASLRGLRSLPLAARWDAKRVLLDPRAPLVAGRQRWCQRDAMENFTPDVSPRVAGVEDAGLGGIAL